MLSQYLMAVIKHTKLFSRNYIFSDQHAWKQTVLQSGVHRVQERSEEPARAHCSAQGGGM